jgi:hypothetical protein
MLPKQKPPGLPTRAAFKTDTGNSRTRAALPQLIVKRGPVEAKRAAIFLRSHRTITQEACLFLFRRYREWRHA